MPNPSSSSGTSIFTSSGVSTIDPLLNESFQKWSAGSFTQVALTYSFPWSSGATAYWQEQPYYSQVQEQLAATHFGLNAAQIVATTEALQAWADVAAITFTEVTETRYNVGDFRFAFSSAVGSGAWGYSSYPNNYWANAADVWINPSVATESDWNDGSYNMLALIHETGHGLGLKHPGNYDALGGDTPPPYLPENLDYRTYTVMSYNSRNFWYLYPGQSQYAGVYPSTPMVYDIAAIQYLYGANGNYHTGDDTYRFNPLTPFCLTIWDAGGNDTLDVSNFSTRCDIDLTPGHYSSIRYATVGTIDNLYDGTDNLGIAFGALLENAVGGSNADILTGNNLNNMLAGGGGNDTLNGGAGNDTLDGGDGVDTAVFSGNFIEYIIHYDTGTFIYVVQDKVSDRDGTDSTFQIEYFTFADAMLLAADVLPDLVAPTVAFSSPLDGAVDVSVSSDIILTFSEAIQKGAGIIALHSSSASGKVVESYDVATSTNLTVSGSSLTITPGTDLAYRAHYVVTFDEGSISDLAGNRYAGTESYNFTTASPLLHALAGNVTFWKSGAAIADVTSTLASMPVSAGTLPVEFRNIQVAADASRTIELWKTSAKSDIHSLQLEFALPEGSVASWQDASGLPSGWNSLVNTGTSGFFVLADTGITALSAESLQLGTLTLTVPSNSQHFDLSLSTGWLGNDVVPTFGTVLDSTATGADGLYQHHDMAAGTYTLSSAKAAVANDKGAVDLLDAIAILKSIVGLTTLNDYQQVAADFDKVNGVDLNDAIGILKHVVGLPAPMPEWVFMQGNVTPHLADSITVDIIAGTAVDLVGILRGDVDGSGAG